MTTLRILSYNIHHGEGSDGRIDLERLGRVISATQADLVALQELDEKTTRSVVSQVGVLGELTGLKSAFGPAFSVLGGEYGVGVLSRWRIEACRAFALPNAEKLEPRVVMGTIIALPGGERIVFANTHLEHFSGPLRLEQAKAINRWVPAWAREMGHGEARMILAGDMNAEPRSDVLGELGRLWVNGNADGVKVTYFETGIEIDYVMFRPGERFEVVSHQVLERVELAEGMYETREASDHYPVLVTVRLK